jgi:hypothetical protein
MNMKLLNEILAGAILITCCWMNLANATLINRGNGMIYDSVQNITWLQNANLSGTKMNWEDSLAWADSLSVGSFDDWRLSNPDPICGLAVYNCTVNELGHLFYNEFGLTQGQGVSSLFGGTNANFNLFINVQASIYWSGAEYAPLTASAWYFNTNTGIQSAGNKQNGLYYGWAVRDGDVVAVPAFRSLAIFSLGLLGLAACKRQGRQRAKLGAV